MQDAPAWTIDSGSEYDVLGPEDLSEAEASRVIPLARPIPLVTGSGATTAESGIGVDPFGSGSPTGALILPGCPPIVCPGKLFLDMGFDFEWKATSLPFTTPDGKSHKLELESRVPVWPLRRSRG
jgi:hypothetical protein